MKFALEKAQEAVEEVRRFSRLVQISADLKAVPEDPDDDMVVECAVVGKANYIVTGDKHLLNLGQYRDIGMIKATQFLALPHHE